MITGRTPEEQRQRASAGVSGVEMDSSGVSGVEMPVAGYQVTLLDLPGDPGLRTLWEDYYPRCHGLLFVVDSAEGFRPRQSTKVFRGTLKHRHVIRKPVLLLLNKQDHYTAWRQEILEKKLGVQGILKLTKCPCIVLKSSAMPDCHKSLGIKAIQCGLRGLLRKVSRDYQVLCRRVEYDTERIRTMDEETRRFLKTPVMIKEEPEGKGEMKGEVLEGSERASVTAFLESCTEERPPQTLQVLKPAARKVHFKSSTAQSSKAFEFEQVTLPGTPIDGKVVVNSCPIVRCTSIDTGDDNDLLEKSVDGSGDNVSQVVDSLSVKSYHLLASSYPWLDPAMRRDLSISLQEQLHTFMTAYDKQVQLDTQDVEIRFSDTVLIEHQGNHGRALCQSSTLEQEEEVRALCQSSTLEQEEEVRALCQSSTLDQEEEVRALCQSSTLEQEEEVRALCEKEKNKWKFKFSKHFKKSRKTKVGQPEITQTSSHKDFIPVSPNTVCPAGSQSDAGSQLQEGSTKRSVFAKAFSSFRKGLCNIFKRKNRILPCTI